jgi:heat shock protein HslJ
MAMVLGIGPQTFAQDRGLPSGSDTPATSTAIPIAMLDFLERNTWQLVSYRAGDNSTVAAFSDRPATFQFESGRLTGTTGCNRFFNDYSRAGEQLSIAQGGTTRMACFPEALAVQEAAIMTGLPQVASYTQTGDQLLLLDGDGNTLLTLMPQPTATLTGTAWTLTVYNNGRGGLTTPISDTTITANFDPEQGLVGSAGCNRYRATFDTHDDSLAIGPAASTRRLCAGPEGIMAQESAFLALLEEVAVYTIRGNQLDLKNADDITLARFTTAE